jgi:hypothetical protein
MRAQGLSVAACLFALGVLAPMADLLFGAHVLPPWLSLACLIPCVGFSIAAFVRYRKRALWTLLISVPALLAFGLVATVVLACAMAADC